MRHMKTNILPFFQKNKTTLLIGTVALLLIGAAILLFRKKDKPANYNQAYSKYIEAYTSGTISKKSYIRAPNLYCQYQKYTTAHHETHCSPRLAYESPLP